MVCESVGKADLLSDHFDSSKDSRESAVQGVHLLSRKFTCCPIAVQGVPSLIAFAFRPSEARRRLLDLDPCGGTDPLGMFPLF